MESLNNFIGPCIARRIGMKRDTVEISIGEIVRHGRIAHELSVINEAYARLHALVVEQDEHEQEAGVARSLREIRALLDMATNGGR